MSTAALDEFARLSGGNLQVLTELVRGATERGVLVHDRGTWQLVGDLPTTVALDELVDEHLAGVDAAGLAVLELLAVCERFGLADLERRHGLETLERLEAGRLVSVVVAGRRTALRLAHPLYGEVLRARMPPLRLRRIQQELADVVEGHGARRREDVVQVALWRIASGGRVAGEQLLRAARLALAGHDPNLAMQLIEAWPDDDDASSFARTEVLAEAHDMLGQHDDVERVVTAALARELTDAAARLAEPPVGRDPFLVTPRPGRRAGGVGRSAGAGARPRGARRAAGSPSDAAGGRRSPRRGAGGPRLDRRARRHRGRRWSWRRPGR